MMDDEIGQKADQPEKQGGQRVGKAFAHHGAECFFVNRGVIRARTRRRFRSGRPPRPGAARRAARATGCKSPWPGRPGPAPWSVRSGSSSLDQSAGLSVLGLAEMLGETVADDLDLFELALDLEFLALEQDQPAREFLDDLAAALVELALLAAELLELLLLPLDFLLLPLQVEELLLDVLDLEIDFVGGRGRVGLGGGGQEFLLFRSNLGWCGGGDLRAMRRGLLGDDQDLSDFKRLARSRPCWRPGFFRTPFLVSPGYILLAIFQMLSPLTTV